MEYTFDAVLHEIPENGGAYVIFPIHRMNVEDGVIVAVDEILNKGIHPENDHSSGIAIGQKYVGRKCITILQEG